ncbi:MAG TPA: hypothetical protein VFM15_05690 [Gammaproteobacteria bacterium]|nr:hypothetical protein [Gammaproteobacteria bacterium]
MAELDAQKRVPGLTANRRRARRTALVFGLIALAFYVGIFCLMHWRHALS